MIPCAPGEKNKNDERIKAQGKQGARDKAQETRHKRQGTRDKAQETSNKIIYTTKITFNFFAALLRRVIATKAQRHEAKNAMHYSFVS